MDHRIGAMHKPVVIARFEPELWRREIAAKNPDFRLQIFIESRKRQVQLQGVPKPQLRVTWIAAAHQQIQGRVMLVEQIRGDMRADVPGPTGQEYCHVAPFVPVFTASPFLAVEVGVVVGAGGIRSTRGARASSARPSISGYVHRRNAGI